mmetsp:Transcript_25477/g.71421  ORF Transcript_25477/g.71421 Transcript_25477/m.71421 type:complete len:182 (-) Transcript_25477:356-901(-)
MGGGVDMTYTVEFEAFPDDRLVLGMYEGDLNMEALLNEVKAGGLCVAIIRPRNVLDLIQLEVAGLQALIARSRGKLATHVLESELLYCLSGGTNISNAYRQFGGKLGDTRVLLAAFNCDAASRARWSALVGGSAVTVTPKSLAEWGDAAAATVAYGVPKMFVHDHGREKLVKTITSQIAAP